MSTDGDGQAQLHEREQRVAAGEQLGVVADSLSRATASSSRAGPAVVERGGDHVCASLLWIVG